MKASNLATYTNTIISELIIACIVAIPTILHTCSTTINVVSIYTLTAHRGRCAYLAGCCALFTSVIGGRVVTYRTR